MPKIMRFYALHCTIGFVVSAVFIAGLLYFNVANLWHLISTSDIGVLALLVFWVLNGIVFAGVQTAVAVMMMAENPDEDDRPEGGTPVAVRVEAANVRN
jgi:hypothetical protein